MNRFPIFWILGLDDLTAWKFPGKRGDKSSQKKLKPAAILVRACLWVNRTEWGMDRKRRDETSQRSSDT
nr:hypothetical protein [uncultured Desulfobacter sp.]